MRRVNSLWCKSCSLLHRSPQGSPDTFFLRSSYACTGFRSENEPNIVRPKTPSNPTAGTSVRAPSVSPHPTSRTATPALVRLVLSAVRREHRLPCQFPLTQHVHIPWICSSVYLTGELATRQYNRPLISISLIFSRRSSAIESHASQAQGLVRACVVRPLFVYPSGFPQPRGPPETQLPRSVYLTAFRVIESVWAWSRGRSCPGMRARTFVDG